jgi:hypothetical protein
MNPRPWLTSCNKLIVSFKRRLIKGIRTICQEKNDVLSGKEG